MNKLNNIVRGTGSLIGSVSNPVVRGSSSIINKTASFVLPRATQAIASFMEGYNGASNPAPTVKQLELALAHAKAVEGQQ
jgi:hypothetical protein|tara:strand:- start:499 stop:738 length:240 start_codon:yes stop_codon:yes gene_type:complete